MRGRLVVGNWKCNGSLSANQTLLADLRRGTASIKDVECAVCAPYPYLGQVRDALSGSSVTWGGQDVSRFGRGAYTGAVSADMLADFGCRYGIVGHSERRSLFDDSDAVVATKFKSALAAGLTPILCVGESLQEREAGVTESVVLRQLGAVMDAQGVQALERAVVAYEPVWAIGTGKTATPEQAQAVHAYIRSLVSARDAGVARNLRILYGGSVKASNAAELFSMPDIDGGLIGGASLVAEEFIAICRAAIH